MHPYQTLRHEKRDEVACSADNCAYSQIPAGVIQVTHYFTESLGGIATMVATLVARLSRNSTVTVIIDNADAKPSLLPGVHIETRNYRLPYGGDSLAKALAAWLIYFVPTLFALARIFRRRNSRLVHLHYVSAHQHYFRVLGMLRRCRYVVTLHGSDVVRYAERSWIERWLIRFVLKGACRVVGVSEALAQRAQQQFPCIRGKVAVIYNGVDIQAIESALSEHTGLSAANPLGRYFVAVGGLLPVKGHDVAIRAWTLVRQKLPDLNLVIVGDGQLREQYQRLITDLGCGDRVHLLGELAPARVWQIMAQAEGLVMPSRSEGLPYTILEAGVANIPVIASRVGGIPEVIRHGQEGVLVPPDDPEALARAVIDLRKNPDQAARLAAALRERVRLVFSADTMARRYEDLYWVCRWGVRKENSKSDA